MLTSAQFSCFLAWEVVDMRRSFFCMTPGSKKYLTQWFHDVWRNQFLFWAIIIGFVTIFPVLYIPVINDVVFKHTGITWEWGIVFIETVIFFGGVEAWKFGKRRFFRSRETKQQGGYEDEDVEARVFKRYLTESQASTASGIHSDDDREKA